MKDNYDPPLGGRWEPIEGNLTDEQREALEAARKSVEAARETVESANIGQLAAKLELVQVIKTLPADQIDASSGREVYQAIIDLLT